MMTVSRVSALATSSHAQRAATPGIVPRGGRPPDCWNRSPAQSPQQAANSLGLTSHLPLDDILQGVLERTPKGCFVQLQLNGKSVHIPVQNSVIQGLGAGAAVQLNLQGRSKTGSRWHYQVGQPISPYSASVCALAQACGGRAEFPAAALREAADARAMEAPNTVDLTHVPFVSLDPHVSLVCDQAFYIEKHPQGDGLIVHYAIADATAWVPQDGAMDAEARARGASLHLPCPLPRGVGPGFPMLPPALYQAGATLRAGKPCAAFVVSVHLTAQGQDKAYSLVRGRVRNRAELTYPQYEQLLLPQNMAQLQGTTPYAESLALLPEVAAMCQQRAVARGVSPWQQTNAAAGWNQHLSLLANEAVASYLTLHAVRAPYVTGPNRLHLQPQPHPTLKLPAYVHMTAPLRRYSDLVTQRIVGALLGNSTPPYQNETLLEDIFRSCNAARQRQHTVDARARTLVAPPHQERC